MVGSQERCWLAEEQMEVQAAVGVEAEEAAALGIKSWGEGCWLGRVGEQPQTPGVTCLREAGQTQCSRMTQKRLQSFRNVHFLVWNMAKGFE